VPILIPLQDSPLATVSVQAVLAGDTDLAAALTVKNNLRAVASGGTQMAGDLYEQLKATGAATGDTAMVGFLRLNAEPDQFLAGFLAADTQLIGALASKVGSPSEFAGGTELSGGLSISSEDVDSFVVSVDVLDPALASQSNVRRYAPRLLADGSEVKIRRASLEASPDTLGTEVRVTLLVPDAALVSQAASLTFQVGLWLSGSFHYVDVVSGGRLSGRGNALRNSDGRPADEVTLSIVDVVADRWNRAPRAPVHLYDPQTATAPPQSQLDSNRIEVFGVGYIEPVNVAVPGMRLFDVLAEAYVAGCGFSSVVCNIPNFPVSEVDFSLDGGYDGGVRPLLSLFEPVLFERDNVLYVIDPDAPIPAGMAPRDFTHAQTRELTDSLPQHEPVNALLLRTRANEAGEYFTERLDTETTSSGVFGTQGFTTTDVERRVREYRNFSAPTVVVREELVSERTTVEDSDLNIIERTTETVTFDVFNRRTASVKRTDMRLPDIDSDGALTLLTDVTRQDQLITYRPDPQDPTKDLQDRVITRESGLVLVDDGNQYLGGPYKIPLLDAHRSGYVDPGGDQHLSTEDIRTTIEQLRVRGQQVDVEVRVVNHLADAPTRNSTTTRTAPASVSRRAQSRDRTVLLTVSGTDTDGRRAQTLDTGDLPYDVAVALGQRKLRRLNSPPREVSVTPAYVDVTLKRGTVVELKTRSGAALGRYIVRGYSVEFEQYAQTSGVRASMSVSARELVT